MKIALIQTNPTIGDFQGNLASILTWTERAKGAGCHLAIFPEMSLSGYPPQDLLERPGFISRQQQAVQALTTQVHGIDILCGLITKNTRPTGKPLNNSAMLISQDQLSLVHKRLLPTYDVFDETRYFQPGEWSDPLPWRDLNLGISICEDIFNDPSLHGGPLTSRDSSEDSPRQLYQVNPINDLLRDPGRHPDCLINIAASPFQLGKPEAKLDFFSALCRRTGLPLLYVNQVGGQDSLLFDGQSLIIAADGRLLARASAFQEDMIVFDTDSFTSQAALSLPPPDVAAQVFHALVMGTRDYLKKCGFRSAVLGLSGGVDSALTAAIAAEALGPENVLGVAMPSPYTSQESIEDARQLADNLKIGFTIIPIETIMNAQLSALAPLFERRPPDTTEQNIQARIRGNLLMALANKFGHLLLSTGNKSELAVGYCTLYGDMSGGLAVIADVPKTLVYQICHFVNRSHEIIPNRTITKAPSAELAPNQRDQDDLPPYEVLDPILAAYLEQNKSVREIAASGFNESVVRDVIRRITNNEHKRKQAPMGLKVTSKAFGYGRRYPTSQHFRDDD